MATETPTAIEVLARRLKTERVRARLTQDQLASRAGVSESMIGQIEQMKRVPSLEMLEGIAFALGITAGDLLTDPAERREHPRYIVQFVEWMESEKINSEEVDTLRAAANILIQRRK